MSFMSFPRSGNLGPAPSNHGCGALPALVSTAVDGLFSDQADQTPAVWAGYTSTSLGTIAQATR
jgi:hypothetical protein